MRTLTAILLIALTPSAFAADWELVAQTPIMIKTRPLPNSAIKEVWAEGIIDAPVRDIQDIMFDPDSFPRFMPWVKEARKIKRPTEDGSHYVYTRVEPPMLSSRDYVSQVWLIKGVAEDGSGEFENKWVAVPDLIPSRANVVRLRMNSGSWKVKPLPDGRSFAEYRFAVDPGGAIPAFAANMGNKSGVMDTFKAVEAEGKRRAALRQSTAAAQTLDAGADAGSAADSGN